MATQLEVAEHLDLKERRTRELVREAVIPAGRGRGGYDLDACRVAYIRYLRGLGSGKVKPAPDRPVEQIDYELERARLTKEQADGQELKNAQTRRELAPVELIVWALNRFASQVCPLLEAIPQKVKRRIPSMTASQIEIIKRETVRAQNAASKITVDLNEYRDAGGDAEVSTSGGPGV